MINWLEDPLLGKKCAESFDTLLNQSYNQLSGNQMNDKSAYNIKLLYRQRLFNSTIGVLLDKFKNSDLSLDFKLNYSMAILNLNNYLPKDMIQTYLESVNICVKIFN